MTLAVDEPISLPKNLFLSAGVVTHFTSFQGTRATKLFGPTKNGGSHKNGISLDSLRGATEATGQPIKSYI